MIKPKFIGVCIFLSMLLASGNSCTDAGNKHISSTGFVLVASTPGDSLIKILLNIDPKTKVDFIRWRLAFATDSTFVLNINYGEAKPNTKGFMDGGIKSTLEGTYTVGQKGQNTLPGGIYRLKVKGSLSEISLIGLSQNVNHILTPDNKLMIGNGGWSYTLNREEKIKDDSRDLFSYADAPFMDDKEDSVIFDGRTPCEEIAKDYNLTVEDDCFKIKWRLILHKDSATYEIIRSGDRSYIKKGKWEAVKDSNRTIIKLDPDYPGRFLSLLVGDENVLFFLNKNGELYVGNEDFSCTLNRKTSAQ